MIYAREQIQKGRSRVYSDHRLLVGGAYYEDGVFTPTELQLTKMKHEMEEELRTTFNERLGVRLFFRVLRKLSMEDEARV